MARPQKTNVDYFPHPCKNGDRMNFMREKYGNDGYTAWYMLLEKLGNAHNHYLDLSDKMQFMLVASAIKVPETRFTEIIRDLVTLNAFDKEFWEEYSVVYSEEFVETVSDAYSKRSNDPITKNGLRIHLQGLRGNKPSLRDVNQVKVGIKPQSKVKESKVKFIPPTLEEVSQYCKERNNGINPKKWMARYESNGWMVGKTKMKSWKASIRYWETNNFNQNSNSGINSDESDY